MKTPAAPSLATRADALRDAAAAGLARLSPRLCGVAARLRATDPLTGLLRRPAFLRRAARRLARRPMAALLRFNVDGLAPVNAALGPAAGDACLQALARFMTRAAPGGLVVRWGGDDFVLLLDDEAAAMRAAERVLAATRQAFCAERTRTRRVFPDTAATPLLTLSGGLAHGPGLSLLQLVERAGAALQQARQQGRDRVWADVGA